MPQPPKPSEVSLLRCRSTRTMPRAASSVRSVEAHVQGGQHPLTRRAEASAVAPSSRIPFSSSGGQCLGALVADLVAVEVESFQHRAARHVLSDLCGASRADAAASQAQQGELFALPLDADDARAASSVRPFKPTSKEVSTPLPFRASARAVAPVGPMLLATRLSSFSTPLTPNASANSSSPNVSQPESHKSQLLSSREVSEHSLPRTSVASARAPLGPTVFLFNFRVCNRDRLPNAFSAPATAAISVDPRPASDKSKLSSRPADAKSSAATPKPSPLASPLSSNSSCSSMRGSASCSAFSCAGHDPTHPDASTASSMAPPSPASSLYTSGSREDTQSSHAPNSSSTSARDLPADLKNASHSS